MGAFLYPLHQPDMVGNLMKPEGSGRKAYDRLWPYIPVIYLVLVYLVGGFGQAIVVAEARYVMLGVITLPLFTALVVAGIRIRREQKEKSKK